MLYLILFFSFSFSLFSFPFFSFCFSFSLFFSLFAFSHFLFLSFSLFFSLPSIHPYIRSCIIHYIIYPISTLPEHLHSTSLSYAETTLTQGNSFPSLLSLITCQPVPHSPPHPPSPGDPAPPTLTHHSSFQRPGSRSCFWPLSLNYVCFALKALKLPVFSFELTLLTFSVSSLWIISYIYIHT